MLLNGTGSLDGVSKEKYFMEAAKTEIGGDFDQLPSPRILNNHQEFSNQPKDMFKKDTKVILVYRNPKDVAVSMYYHTLALGARIGYEDLGFSAFLRRFADGLVPGGFCCDFLRDWERGIKANKDLKVCLISYEDMHENSLREVTKLAKFLEKDYDEEFYQKVIRETHIYKIKIKITSTTPSCRGNRSI